MKKIDDTIADELKELIPVYMLLPDIERKILLQNANAFKIRQEIAETQSKTKSAQKAG